jgi:hypothetical protein
VGLGVAVVAGAGISLYVKHRAGKAMAAPGDESH